jgi:indole-3-glycerol phosphate synthase
METILDRIIEEKRKEVIRLKECSQILQNLDTAKRSLIQKLQNSEDIAIIAEFKRASPSKGIINNQLEPVVQAIVYEKNGASAISVLTDQSFFKGSFSDLRAVSQAVTVPVLCKDFIIDPIQIDCAASSGADLILLIAAVLEEDELLMLYQYAKSKGLEVLVEVHDYKELERVGKTGAKLIGVNNRDLTSFHVSLDVTEKLAEAVKSTGAFLISESGIHLQKDVERVKKAGANGILVGEALMKSSDLSRTMQNFRLAQTKEGKL